MSLTNDQITAKNFKEFYDAIRPYLNGSFPTMIANKFDKANLYSTDEKIVGRWIDGKPLYQKTLSGVIPNGINIDQDLEISTSDLDIEQCINISHCHDGSGGNSAIMVGSAGYMYPTPTASLMVWFNGGNDSKIIVRRKENSATGLGGGSTIYVTIEYTKTTDSAMEIGSDTDYSTTEKIIGTWIDGKPLYQKTFQFTTPSSMGQFEISGTDTIDTLVTLDGYELNVNGWKMRLNSYQSAGSYSFINFNSTTKKFYCGSVSDHLGVDVVMTLTYTKTTDSTS